MSADRRRPPAVPRDRTVYVSPRFDERAEGWISYGLSMACPANASAEFVAGYAQRRNETIALICAHDGRISA